MNRVAVLITITGTLAVVASPFEAREIIRTMPVRAWHAPSKSWQLPALDIPVLARRLREAGYVVSIVVTEPPVPQPRPEPNWAEVMFAAIPPRLHKLVYRGLAKILHPDAGGDQAAMTALNAAHEERNKVPA